MKKNEITVGESYIVKVSGQLVSVKIIGPSPYGGWVGRSEKSGREVRVKSAARLRRPAGAAAPAKQEGA